MMLGVQAVYAVRLVVAFGVHTMVLLGLLWVAVRLQRGEQPAARPLFLAAGLEALGIAHLVVGPATQALAYQFLVVEQAVAVGAVMSLVGVAVVAAKWAAVLFALYRLTDAPSGPFTR